MKAQHKISSRGLPDGVAIRDFGGRVVTAASRDLVLLKKIDETIDALSLEASNLIGLCSFAEKATEHIRATTPHEVIDADGGIEKLLNAGQDALSEYRELLQAKRQSGANDKRLRPDDGIVAAYDESIEAVTNLHNSLDELRWAVMVHDADISPVSNNSFKSADDLFASLGL